MLAKNGNRLGRPAFRRLAFRVLAMTSLGKPDRMAVRSSWERKASENADVGKEPKASSKSSIAATRRPSVEVCGAADRDTWSEDVPDCCFDPLVSLVASVTDSESCSLGKMSSQQVFKIVVILSSCFLPKENLKVDMMRLVSLYTAVRISAEVLWLWNNQATCSKRTEERATPDKFDREIRASMTCRAAMWSLGKAVETISLSSLNVPSLNLGSLPSSETTTVRMREPSSCKVLTGRVTGAGDSLRMYDATMFMDSSS